MMEQNDLRSMFSVFASTSATFEEAKRKHSEESSKKTAYFRITKDGTYPIRILPLAPILDAEGNPLPDQRKSYEYPLRSLMLKIEHPTKTEKGKPVIKYVSVVSAKYTFGDRLPSDLIDTYVRVACDKHGDDEALCKKLRANSFSGGLRWDNQRCMYIIDIENPGEGLQILQLSFNQYRELEERKLNLWQKLIKNGKKVGCPISSIENGFPVEITRKTDNGKVSYTFNIDTVSGAYELEDNVLQKLLDIPRLPDVIYHYNRYMLEATIAYLRQIDEKLGINIVAEPEVQECIEQVKMLLPADDNSHFSMDGKGVDSVTKSMSAQDQLEKLYDRLDALTAEGLDDQSEEGRELRISIKEFIDAQNLDIRITRSKSNETVLEEISDALSVTDQEMDEEDEEEDLAHTTDLDTEEDGETEEEEAPSAPSDPEEYPSLTKAPESEAPVARTRRGARPERRR